MHCCFSIKFCLVIRNLIRNVSVFLLRADAEPSEKAGQILQLCEQQLQDHR